MKTIAIMNAIVFGDGNFETETHAVGGGEWSLEIYDFHGIGHGRTFVCEYVGSNGTRDEADDLWRIFKGDVMLAEALLGGGFRAK